MLLLHFLRIFGRLWKKFATEGLFMKKLLVFLFVICNPFYIWSDVMNNQELLVFMTPIKSGQTNHLKESLLLKNIEETSFFQELGISKYYRWIQEIHQEHLLIHLMEGKDLQNSIALIREKIHQKNPIALQLQQLYQDALDIDLSENALPSPLELTGMLTVDIDEEKNSFIKEYAFVYPILPEKKDMLLKMFQDEATYYDEKLQNVYRYRGISKQKLWVQESPRSSFLVLYQEITGPVTEARKKFLNSKDEEFSKIRTAKFSEVTGLSYEDLLPKLESLYDNEVLR
jgi:hypothetical protein